MPKLTDRQKQFVKEYLVDLNASQAALRAGYSDSSYGRVLYAKSHVQAAIAKEREKAQERTSVTADMVVEGLLKEAKNENEPGATRVSAWKALGKHLGLFVDKVENSGTQRIIVEYVEAD